MGIHEANTDGGCESCEGNGKWTMSNGEGTMFRCLETSNVMGGLKDNLCST